MGKDPAMPFYVNDWLSSSRIACMTLEEQGAYVRLLCHCWASQDASLPDDDHRLAALSGMGEGWFANGSRLVRVCFEPHPTKPDHLTHQKLYLLWSERQQWREKSRVGGHNSGISRRLRHAKGGSTTLGTKREPKGNSSSSSSSSSSVSKDPPINTPPSDPVRTRSRRCSPAGERFQDFWSLWPSGRKVGKQKAVAAYERAARVVAQESGRTLDEAKAYINERMAVFGASPKAHGQFCPHPTTWLNEGRYDDDPQAWQEASDDRAMAQKKHNQWKSGVEQQQRMREENQRRRQMASEVRDAIDEIL